LILQRRTLGAMRRFLAAASLACASSLVVTVRNDVPRVDQFGHILNA